MSHPIMSRWHRQGWDPQSCRKYLQIRMADHHHFPHMRYPPADHTKSVHNLQCFNKSSSQNHSPHLHTYNSSLIHWCWALTCGGNPFRFHFPIFHIESRYIIDRQSRNNHLLPRVRNLMCTLVYWLCYDILI